MSKPKSRIAMRVGQGCLEPHDAWNRQRLREKGYSLGDVVGVEIYKVRNPKLMGLAHKFGEMVADNIQQFVGMKPHAVLKRLQWEGNIACEEMGVVAPGLGACVIRIPESLSFENMDDAEFSAIYTAFCEYVSRQYWSELSPAQIEQAGRFYEGQR